ncbi:hypothetical protein [Mucilaginibacter gracilis]|uniref:hypothetical protein n=1 Tax=Mucilaginibacter gracilis TaxID=423350 RepID=UPI002938F4D2|nr:hypothetical protein [Mucilaginibacter gracilis]
MDKQSYNFRNSIKQWMAEVLEVVYAASSLCINTLRVFFLIVLAILGPLVFGLSVFDGFQHSLTQWFARYINIFLWLPIANIFGSIIGQIQQEMLKMDIAQIQSQGDTFFNQTDVAYLVFLLIGIVGYFSVPTVANFVVHAHGHNGMLQRVSGISSTAVSTTGSIAGATGSRALNGAGNIAGLPGNIADGYSGKAGGKGTHGAAGRAMGKTGAYAYDKLSGH